MSQTTQTSMARRIAPWIAAGVLALAALFLAWHFGRRRLPTQVRLVKVQHGCETHALTPDVIAGFDKLQQYVASKVDVQGLPFVDDDMNLSSMETIAIKKAGTVPLDEVPALP